MRIIGRVHASRLYADARKQGDKLLGSKPALQVIVLFLVSFCLLGATVAQVAGEDADTEPFSVIVLPDTQGYSEANPEIFNSQTEWIVENRNRLNIELVVHLGDVVENPKSTEEWRRARRAMARLDRQDIPTLIAFGNHDVIGLGDDRASNPFNEYFPPSRYKSEDHFAGSFSEDSADNAAMTFEFGGHKYLFMTVEYRPRDRVIAWANRVLEVHPDHLAVLVTHSYMWPNGFLTRSGRRTWNGLARKHPGVRMVLCGHVPGAGLEADYGDSGNKVYQILSDYQYYPNGGNGFLRIMTFYPGEGVRVRTYSPYLDSYKDEDVNQFSLVLGDRED